MFSARASGAYASYAESTYLADLLAIGGSWRAQLLLPTSQLLAYIT